ncbi:LuxR C-terminal-related transcriptional regulator [Streptosporangium sp. NPDC002524]|uniref:helix-turn-helix transcriptional regulator n=1 Tax=Streptosporangium sp. NPDC002524 TaxID=3154537 RepID=UPI0033213F8D
MSRSTMDAGERIAASLCVRRRVLSVFWLAEDEISFYGLPLMLRRVPHVVRARVGRSVAEAGQALGGGDFDVVVLPVAAVPQVMASAGALRGRTRVLALTRTEEARHLSSLAGDHGVDGCLPWDVVNVAGLSDAFAHLLSGDPPASPAPPVVPVVPAASAVPAGSLSEPAGAELTDRLTEREHTALTLLLRGMSNNQIARAMGISIHGVKRHVSNLLVKFDCSNRTEVALVAQRLGLSSATGVPRVNPAVR